MNILREFCEININYQILISLKHLVGWVFDYTLENYPIHICGDAIANLICNILFIILDLMNILNSIFSGNFQ